MTFDEKELMKMWQETTLPGDNGQLAKKIAARVGKFDRMISWRNLREYAAGAVLVVYFLWQTIRPATPGFPILPVTGLVVVNFVLIYLWRSQRKNPPLDPAADAVSYQTALLARYDRQIKLLATVKYWYVLPIYLWLLLNLALVPARSLSGRVITFFIVSAFAAFVAWLNEGYAVRKLRAKRAEAEALFNA